MTLNNSTSMVALGNLNKNVKKVGTTLAKIASGDRIPTAKYDSAGLAMSEILREQLRSLHQDQQNVQNGSAMFQTAAGGIDDIISNIRRLKELAINSANDSNSDMDRATIQKEVDASLATIEDIAVGTEYNGHRLLDGTYARVQPPTHYDDRAEPSMETIELTPSMMSRGHISLNQTNAVYKISDSFTTSYTPCILDVNAENVKIIGASGYTRTQINMNVSSSLWLEDCRIYSTNEHSAITFLAQENYLHLLGTNRFECSVSSTMEVPTPIINTVGNLVISGENNQGTDGAMLVGLHRHAKSTRSVIGSAAGESSDANISIVSGTIQMGYRSSDLSTGGFCAGAAIGSGQNASIGNIKIYGGEIDIVISNPSDGSGICEAVVGAGSNGGTCGSVQFKGGTIHLENRTGGIAVDPSYNLPGTFSSYDGVDEAIYDQSLPDASPEDDSENNEEDVWDRPLVIHHGTKSNQMNRFYINSMRATSLGLEKLDITTRSKAESAISKIESALEYALDVATDVGSYMERLEHTESNLEIKSENTALSDSVLRDADMAKEMTEYTKFNVLTQSAQAMLAQAGQNQSQVLSLLQ